MIKNKLREIRLNYGMSISELARRTGTTQQTINRIELHGQIPNGILMITICDVLRSDPKDFFSDLHIIRK